MDKKTHYNSIHKECRIMMFARGLISQHTTHHSAHIRDVLLHNTNGLRVSPSNKIVSVKVGEHSSTTTYLYDFHRF